MMLSARKTEEGYEQRDSLQGTVCKEQEKVEGRSRETVCKEQDGLKDMSK